MIPQTLGVYVYLDSLELSNPKFADQAKAYSTFDLHHGYTNNNKAINPIREAISKLKNIAINEGQKEIQAINNYIRKIDYHINNSDLPKELLDNLKMQRNKIQQLDFQNYQTDQLNFIQAINATIQNLNSYERRLNEITNPITNDYQFQERLEFSMQTRLEEFLKRQGKKGRNDTVLINRDQKLFKMMDKEIDRIFKNCPEEFAYELKSLLFIDFNNWVENISSRKTSYYNITQDDIEQIFNEYIKAQENDLTATHFQRTINKSEDDLFTLLEEMKNTLHSTYLSEKDYQYLENKINERKSNKKKTDISFKGSTLTYKQAKDLVETYKYNLGDPDKRFSFTLHSSVSHGNFYEFMSTIFKSAVNIEGNVAGDLIIPIGTVTFTEDEQKEQQELMKLSNGLQRILTDDFKTRQQITMDTFDEAVEREKLLSKNLKNKIEQSRKEINNLNDLNQQFFIAHETTKLYRGAEKENSNFEDFHGRKMAALSSMAKLYSSSLSDSMIDPQMLMLYLINISDVTLAKNKYPLETYLSLFAGLLMFDDIRDLAETGIQEIQQNVETASTIESIHVYNIGGVYYPISIILNNLVAQMESLIDEMGANYDNTAHAEIIQPPPSSQKMTSLDDWKSLADRTIQSTYIQIHFLAGYTEYIKKLFTNFNM